ncbi:hypothetical protein BDV93DRAFT_606995 [Ceratobasidium sp. AG-I]|nr:hypothetical protein BDV93DRAFT_606995 [Ceratobasidium sp. AG-I]
MISWSWLTMLPRSFTSRQAVAMVIALIWFLVIIQLAYKAGSLSLSPSEFMANSQGKSTGGYESIGSYDLSTDIPQPAIPVHTAHYTSFWNVDVAHQRVRELPNGNNLDIELPILSSPTTNPVVKRDVEGTALSATISGGVALVALSHDAETTLGDEFLSACADVYGFDPRDLSGSVFSCLYEHLLLHREPLYLSTANVRKDCWDLVRGVFLVLAQPDIFGLFVLVVSSVCTRRRRAPVASVRLPNPAPNSTPPRGCSCDTCLSQTGEFEQRCRRRPRSYSCPARTTTVNEIEVIEEHVFVEDIMVAEDSVIAEESVREKDVLLVEFASIEELVPILEPESIEESANTVTAMATQYDATFNMPVYGPDEFRFDRSRWIDVEPVDLAALQTAQEYTPPQTPMSMLSLEFAETTESDLLGLSSVEETKAGTDALIARFEWENRMQHEAISDVLAKYHGFYAGEFPPHPLPQIVRPVPIAAPPIVPALRQLFPPYPAPQPPARTPQEVPLPPSPEPQPLAASNSTGSLSTPPPDEAVGSAPVSTSPAPPRLRKIAVFTSGRGSLKPRRM